MPEHTTTADAAGQESDGASTEQQESEVAAAPQQRSDAAQPEPRPSGDRPSESLPSKSLPSESLPSESRPLEGRSSEPPSSEPLRPERQPAEALSENQVKLALRRVKDPELNLNIVDLGLVYGTIVEGRDVRVQMTLTSPGCPAGPEIMRDAEEQLRAIPDVGSVAVELVWSPLWSPERIEPRIRAYLGL